MTLYLIITFDKIGFKLNKTSQKLTYVIWSVQAREWPWKTSWLLTKKRWKKCT